MGPLRGRHWEGHSLTMIPVTGESELIRYFTVVYLFFRHFSLLLCLSFSPEKA